MQDQNYQRPPFWRKHVLRWPPKNGMVDDCELWNFLLGPAWLEAQIKNASGARKKPIRKAIFTASLPKITQWDTGSNYVTRIWFRVFLSELEGPTSAQRTHPYVLVKKGRRQKRQLNGEIQQVDYILWVIQPRRLTQPQRFRVSLPKCAPYTPQISCNPKEPLSIQYHTSGNVQ